MWAFLQHLSFWDWLALGTVLLILEVFGAGGYLLWIGMAAASVGVLTFLMPLEASSMIGAVGGIGEIVKATFDNKKA